MPLHCDEDLSIGDHLESLDVWFVEHGLAFACWYAGYPESWGAERVVFAGTGLIETYPATE